MKPHEHRVSFGVSLMRSEERMLRYQAMSDWQKKNVLNYSDTPRWDHWRLEARYNNGNL